MKAISTNGVTISVPCIPSNLGNHGMPVKVALHGNYPGYWAWVVVLSDGSLHAPQDHELRKFTNEVSAIETMLGAPRWKKFGKSDDGLAQIVMLDVVYTMDSTNT